MSTDALVKMIPLRFSYVNDDQGDSQVILDDASFLLRRGEAHSLRGDNMTGKTTLVRLLTGHLSAPDISFEILGTRMLTGDPVRARLQGIAAVHQGDPLFPDLSIWENVCLGAPTRQRYEGVRRDVRRTLEESLRYNGEAPRLERPLRSLSGGARALVRLIRSVAWGFEALLLDEPTSGVDPAHLEQLFMLLERYLDRSRAVLLISHSDEDHSRLKRLAQARMSTYSSSTLSNGHLLQHP